MPPTKIAIQLPPSISNAVITSSNPASSTTPTVVQNSSSPTVVNTATGPKVLTSTPTIIKPVGVDAGAVQQNSTMTSVRPQQVITTASGQKVILMTNPGQKQVINVPQNTNVTPVTLPTNPGGGGMTSGDVTPTPKTQSLLMTSLTSPPKTPASKPSIGGANADKFEVTQEFIQQTIQNALKKDNLSPEMEHKLHSSLQAYSESNPGGNRSGFGKNKVEIDPATGEPMDEEWDGASYAERSIANKNKRKKIEQNVINERIAINSGGNRSGPATPSALAAARSQNKPATPISNSVSTEEKKRQLIQNKLQSMLLSQKEQLKRQIKQKRVTQEKDISAQIKEDITKMQVKTVTLTAGQPMGQPSIPSIPKEDLSTNSSNTPEPVDVAPPATLLQNSYEAIASGGEILNNIEINNKRKRHDSDDTSESSGTPQPPKAKKKRRSSGQASVKKDKLYCICKTRYDPKK